MVNYIKTEEPTPGGGDYSEIYFFDENGKPADKDNAAKFVIRECKKNGELIQETWGMA